MGLRAAPGTRRNRVRCTDVYNFWDEEESVDGQPVGDFGLGRPVAAGQRLWRPPRGRTPPFHHDNGSDLHGRADWHSVLLLRTGQRGDGKPSGLQRRRVGGHTTGPKQGYVPYRVATRPLLHHQHGEP